VLFSLSKLFVTLTSPINLLVVLIFSSMLIVTFVPFGFLHRWGKRIGVFSVILMTLIAVTPIGYFSVEYLENLHSNVKLPRNVTGIIVLAADENPNISEKRHIPIMGSAAQRYIYLKRLSKTYPRAKIILVGSTNALYPSGKMTTKQVIQPVLDIMNIPRWRTRYETKSRNTHENAILSAKKIKPSSKEKWLLVTSAYHMQRALLSFKKAGWNVVPSPSDYLTSGKEEFHFGLNMPHNVRLLSIAAHEYYGLLSYWLMGWIDKPW